MPQKTKVDREKDQHIHVSVRCRPLNTAEKKSGAYSMVDCNGEKREVHVKERQLPTAPVKTFTFDKVFTANSKQIDVYKSVAQPVLEEVLMGYNCTIFAYGQTSTGKTFTMEGEHTDDPNLSWENDPLSGIIPRAMHHLFSRLTMQDCEFSVKVSFLEIYNEELIDLLGAESVDNPRLKIYEDAKQKPNSMKKPSDKCNMGTCVIQGLEEVTVRNKSEVYAILERGAQRRQTAATIMNAHSSRSHSLFMVTVHIKENSVEGEELLKTGKLNLVDLAGSENIGRSGAIDKRAREAGNINQSLLTLGRCITALVEHAPHIPFRESKLTRLLQDSLGGRTKTSIIATISPASCNLEETLSTLDYAHRAKNITNRPEINQKLTKKALLKEYTEEMERLRKDLQAARDKNGVFLAHENYEEILTTINQQKDSIKDLEERIASVNEEFARMSDMFSLTKEELEQTSKELEETIKILEDTKEQLKKTQASLRRTTQDRDEQKYLVSQHVKTETKLHGQAKELLHTADVSTSDVSGLHAKLDRKRDVESHNETTQEDFQQRFNQNIEAMESRLQEFSGHQQQSSSKTLTDLGSLLSTRKSEVTELQTDLTSFLAQFNTKVDLMRDHQSTFTQQGEKWVTDLSEMCSKHKNEQVCRQFDFLQESVLVSMAGIQQSLSQHRQSLDVLSQLLHAQMEEQKAHMACFAAEVEQGLQAQRDMVAGFTQQQVTVCDQQTADISKTLEVISKITDLLPTLTNHAQTVQAAIDKQQKHVNSFNTEATEHLEKVSSGCSKGDQRHQEQIASNTESAQKHITQTSQDIEGTSEACVQFETYVSSFSKDTQEITKTHTEEVLEHLQHHQTVIVEARQVQEEYSQGLEEDTKTTVKELDEKEASHCAAFETQMHSLQTALEEKQQNITDNCSDFSFNLDARKQEVDKFLLQELKKDMPTGETPQRRDFQYPKNLTKTNRHSLLLNDFRKEYVLQEAINLPIPDDSLNDSQCSVDQIPPLNFDAGSQDEDEEGNVSTDSAVSSSSRVSSLGDVQDCKKNKMETSLGKENQTSHMGPPRAAPKVRHGSTKSKQPAPSRSRTPTPKKGSTSDITPTATKKTGTPSSTAKPKTKLPLKQVNA